MKYIKMLIVFILWAMQSWMIYIFLFIQYFPNFLQLMNSLVILNNILM